MNKNIILIGFMGCGKTSIGKNLSIITGKMFIDTDEQIQNDIGMSISQIFEQFGEKYFRKLENDLCRQISKSKNKIIATGGGIVKNSNNMKKLMENGIVIYLKSSPEKIYDNLKCDNSRPLLDVPDKFEKIKELFNQRVNIYESYAQITIDTTKNNINENTQLIIEQLQKL